MELGKSVRREQVDPALQKGVIGVAMPLTLTLQTPVANTVEKQPLSQLKHTSGLWTTHTNMAL